MMTFESPQDIGDFAITVYREQNHDDRWHVKVFSRLYGGTERSYVVEYNIFEPKPASQAEQEAVLEAIRTKRPPIT